MDEGDNLDGHLSLLEVHPYARLVLPRRAPHPSALGGAQHHLLVAGGEHAPAGIFVQCDGNHGLRYAPGPDAGGPT